MNYCDKQTGMLKNFIAKAAGDTLWSFSYGFAEDEQQKKQALFILVSDNV